MYKILALKKEPTNLKPLWSYLTEKCCVKPKGRSSLCNAGARGPAQARVG